MIRKYNYSIKTNDWLFLLHFSRYDILSEAKGKWPVPIRKASRCLVETPGQVDLGFMKNRLKT